MAKLTGGQTIVETLRRLHVDTVFGIPSIHTLDLHDALLDARERLRYIAGRTELGLGYMADGYSRATGRPGVFITSTGPGAADSVGAMGEAYFSATPVLQITTNVEAGNIDSGRLVTHEPKDQLGMFRSVTDWNALVPSVEGIPDHLYEAFNRFRTRRPRPIELEAPTDILGRIADVEIGPPPPAHIPDGAEHVEETVRLLRRAKRPAILVGEEMNFTGGMEALVQLAERLGTAVALTDGGKGAFPEDHPLCAGSTLVNRVWGKNPIADFLPTCDLVLVLGAALYARSTAAAGLTLPDGLVHVTLDGALIGKNYRTSLGVEANAGLFAQRVLSALGGADVDKGPAYRKEVGDLKRRVQDGLREQFPNQYRALAALREVLPRDTVVACDPTVPAYAAARVFQAYGPNTFLSPHGWAGLGYSFPASIGAKAGVGSRNVVCITGDGGFQYCIQELATCAQHGLAPVVLLFNDNAWGVLRGYQRDRFKGRTFMTDLVNPDFMKIAEAYGLPHARVSSVDGLARAVGDALGAKQAHLIEVPIPNGFASFR